MSGHFVVDVREYVDKHICLLVIHRKRQAFENFNTVQLGITCKAKLATG